MKKEIELNNRVYISRNNKNIIKKENEFSKKELFEINSNNRNKYLNGFNLTEL